MITFKEPIIGDIVTFDYNEKYKNVKATILGFNTYKSCNGKEYKKPILRLSQDISYTSTHHAGGTFKKDTIVDFLDPWYLTINDKTSIRTLIRKLKWDLYFAIHPEYRTND